MESERDPVRDARARRRTAYGLRAAHRPLVRDLHSSVACCGFIREKHDAKHDDDDFPMASLQVTGDRASLTGVSRCNSPWACPVCAPKVAAARAETLKPQVAELMQRGYSAWLITLTVRHEHGIPLADTFDVLKKAWGRVTSGRRWQEIRDVGAPEYARGYDLTWSSRNGWHPHVHLSLYLPKEHGDGREVAEWVRKRWMEVLGKLGWTALPGAQDVQACRDAEAAARYSVTPAAVYESLAMALKRGRNSKSGRTPFELLADAVSDAEAGRAGGSRAVNLWREYVEATKGRRQVTVSRGLSLKEDEPEVVESDEDADDDEVLQVADLGPTTILELDRRRLTAPLFDVVEEAVAACGDVFGAARGFLRQLDARDWSVFDPDTWGAAPVTFEAPGWAAPQPTDSPVPAPPKLPRRARDQADAYAAWKEGRDQAGDAPCSAPGRQAPLASIRRDAPRPDATPRPARAAEVNPCSQGPRLHGAAPFGAAEEDGVERGLTAASTVAPLTGGQPEAWGWWESLFPL